MWINKTGRNVLSAAAWKRKAAAAAVSLTLLLAPLNTAWAAEQANDDTLLSVFHLLLEKHYSHPDEQKLLQGALKGMLEIVDDPYTNYMSPEQYTNFMNAINQSYAGIGTSLAPEEDGAAIRVADVFPDTPAAKAGIAAGDRIVEVDGVPITKDTIDAAPDRIRGKAGTTVHIGIVRDGKPLTFTLTRQNVRLPEISSQQLQDGIAYIRIYSFGETTAAEFEQALNEAQRAKPKGLVLDLRGNGGGYVSAALAVADLFMKQGKILVLHQNGRDVNVDADANGTDLPLAVLIDGGTASASEILAGALQRNGRAKLVGETSYGKGTMQEPITLPDGGVLKVSIDRWGLPDGTSIDRTGLEPDLRMERPEAAVNAAVQLLTPERPQTLSLSRTKPAGKLNGTIDLADVPAPVEAVGSLYLPLRYVFESFGTEVEWDEPAWAVRFQHEGKRVDIGWRDKTLTVDGELLNMPDPLRDENGTAYISIDAIRAITGEPVDISGDSVLVRSK